MKNVLKKWPIDEKVLMLVAESPKQENGNFFPGCVCNDFFFLHMSQALFLPGH